jgi:hypothetical protein
MSTPCNNGVTSNYKPGVWNLTGLKVGFTYSAVHTFSGTGVDITADDFEIIVTTAAGAPVDTLVIGTGLTIDSATALSIVIGSPITDAAGTYNLTAVRTEAGTGAEYPYAVGKIVVSP